MRIFDLPLNRAEHVGYSGRRRYFDLYKCECGIVGSGRSQTFWLKPIDIHNIEECKPLFYPIHVLLNDLQIAVHS